MPCLSNVESFLISSDLIASQLLLESAHCIPLSPQSVSSHLISTHLMSSEFFHLISSHPMWCLLSLSRLFSADHNCSHLFSCHLSFSHLFSSHLSFSAFHSSSQLFSALHSSCKLILCVLISSLLFSLLLSSSHIYSADLSSCQLVSPHLSSRQRTLKSSHLFSGPKPAPKTDLGAKASNDYVFHIEDLRSFYTQQAFAQRSLYTQKLFTQS